MPLSLRAECHRHQFRFLLLSRLGVLAMRLCGQKIFLLPSARALRGCVVHLRQAISVIFLLGRLGSIVELSKSF